MQHKTAPNYCIGHFFLTFVKTYQGEKMSMSTDPKIHIKNNPCRITTLRGKQGARRSER